MSGHSKWSQIKHKKGAADAKRGQLFSKLVREITVAAREGGAQPEGNARLAAAMERAKAAGMPKENIERALAKVSGGGDGAMLDEFLYEASVSGGVAILIEGITDSKNRTLAEIKHVLSQRGAKMAESGSLLWNFEKVGIIEAAIPEGSTQTPDDLELIIIDAGAQDVAQRDGVFQIETEFVALNNVRRALDAAGLEIKDFGHEYKPRAAIEAPQDRGGLDSLLDALVEHDDVQEVYTNIKEK